MNSQPQGATKWEDRFRNDPFSIPEEWVSVCVCVRTRVRACVRVFVALRFESRDWRLLVQLLFLAIPGTREEHKPKLLSPDIFRWGRGLPPEGVGAKKFGMSLETREIKHFGRDVLGFSRDIPGAAEKFEKKGCVQCSSPRENCGMACESWPRSILPIQAPSATLPEFSGEIQKGT